MSLFSFDDKKATCNNKLKIKHYLRYIYIGEIKKGFEERLTNCRCKTILFIINCNKWKQYQQENLYLNLLDFWT